MGAKVSSMRLDMRKSTTKAFLQVRSPRRAGASGVFFYFGVSRVAKEASEPAIAKGLSMP